MQIKIHRKEIGFEDNSKYLPRGAELCRYEVAFDTVFQVIILQNNASNLVSGLPASNFNDSKVQQIFA